MTVRGICLVIPGLLGTAAGLLTSNSALGLLSLSVVLWLMMEWLWFQWRMIREIPSLAIQRTVNNRSNSTDTCFAGRRLRISVTVRCHKGQLHPWTGIRDLIPDILTVTHGCTVERVVNTAKQLVFQYECRPKAAGIAIIPGCRLRFQDPNGFFLCDRFISARQTLRILPDCKSRLDQKPKIIRLSSLPQQGMHRMHRAGTGSELLDLREYVPGDPPKSIAWKVSARRDKLMTRDYESEVPVRTIIFVDISSQTRRGQWGSRPCDVSSHLAAGICRTVLSAGDPVGLTLFSESTTRSVSPGWGERTLFRALGMLADSCCADDWSSCWTHKLQDLAMEVCEERYPELLDSRINRVPWTLFPMTPWNRRINKTRARLASVLCQIHQLEIIDWAKLLYDDDFMGYHISRMLRAAGRTPATHSCSRTDRQNPESLNETLQQLTNGLRRATARARDNEHYFIIFDLIEAEHLFAAIRPVIQLLRARHHRVSFVCPTPSSHGVSGNDSVSRTAPILLREARQIEMEERRHSVAKKLRSLGAGVTFADKNDPLSRTLATLSPVRPRQTATGVM